MNGYCGYVGPSHDPDAYYGPSVEKCDEEIAYLEHQLKLRTAHFRETIRQYKSWRHQALAAQR